MEKITGCCGPMDAVKIGVDTWKVVCPLRPGVTGFTKASDEGEIVENICGSCPVRKVK